MCGQALSCGNAQGRRQIKSAGDDDSLERLGVNTLIGNKEWHWRWANANAKMHSIEMQVPRGCESQGGRGVRVKAKKGKTTARQIGYANSVQNGCFSEQRQTRGQIELLGGSWGSKCPPIRVLTTLSKGRKRGPSSEHFFWSN